MPALSKAQKEKIALFKTSLSKLNEIHRYVKLAKTKHFKLELKFVQSLEPFIKKWGKDENKLRGKLGSILTLKPKRSPYCSNTFEFHIKHIFSYNIDIIHIK